MWLATESLLDSIAPKQESESETKWLRRALRAAHAGVGLQNFLPPGSATDPPNDAYKFFYNDRRKAIFHSKPGRAPILPHGSTAWESLSEAHRLLTRFYLRLVDHHPQVSRRSGGIFQGFLKRMMTPWEGKLRLHVTDDDRPVEPTDTALDPGGGIDFPLATRPAPELDRRWVKVFLGGAPVAELAPLARVSRVVAEVDGELVAYENLEGRLDVTSLGRFEAAVGLSARNANEPRDRFLT